MISKPEGLDNKVEATLVATVRDDDMIKLAPGVYVHADLFAEVHPLGGDPERAKTLKALRTELVEERLAAASARNNTTMAERKVGEIADTLRQREHELAELRRQHRLAVSALHHFQNAVLPEERSPLFEQLLGADGKAGSIAEPCNAVFTINRRYPGCGCDEPCLESVAAHPCALRRGHPFVLGKEKHRTLYGRDFDTDESMLIGEDDG
ncbi:hypothetical protein [Actinophytocola sp.]|uniref:hypothetical protein n=1 Tax=Actinophytocola sp. TaxID=1872138 RepID=UPI002D7E8B6B|nr:hypothetical protein [Actinophytocola sp.]HET9144068.1 hypothetical protein [Actinophytocola sp.]